jgi:hypothetical protein
LFTKGSVLSFILAEPSSVFAQLLIAHAQVYNMFAEISCTYAEYYIVCAELSSEFAEVSSAFAEFIKGAYALFLPIHPPCKRSTVPFFLFGANFS